MEIKCIKLLRPFYKKAYTEKTLIQKGEDVWNKLNQKLPKPDSYAQYRLERFASASKHLSWLKQLALREYLLYSYEKAQNEFEEHTDGRTERAERQIIRIYQEHLVALHVPIPF